MIASDHDLYYFKFMRWFRCSIYRKIVRSMPQGYPLQSFVVEGLQAAYSPEEARKEFERWYASTSPEHKAELEGWLPSVWNSEIQSHASKRESIFRAIAERDITRAIELAMQRRSAIIDSRAF